MWRELKLNVSCVRASDMISRQFEDKETRWSFVSKDHPWWRYQWSSSVSEVDVVY